jgi:hypothetical protein
MQRHDEGRIIYKAGNKTELLIPGINPPLKRIIISRIKIPRTDYQYQIGSIVRYITDYFGIISVLIIGEEIAMTYIKRYY